MRRDPVLVSRTLKRPYNRTRSVFTVEGGLHFLRGNSSPYFSLTYTERRLGFPHQCYSCGYNPDEIELQFPGRFTDLAALHLSSIDGVPMHAEADGWYWLAGALGGVGEEYHGGNGGNGGTHRTPAECLAVFARHCRISLDEARAIAAEVDAADRDEESNPYRNLPKLRAAWARLMAPMYPRWRAEAEACIARHNLRVYGDPWTPPEVTP